MRYFAEKFRQIAGKPVIVLNRPGADGGLSAEFVARSKPNGYTMLFHVGSALAANTYLYKPQYNILKDFSPVTTLLKVPFVVVVPADSPVRTVEDLFSVLRQGRVGRLVHRERCGSTML